MIARRRAAGLSLAARETGGIQRPGPPGRIINDGPVGIVVVDDWIRSIGHLEPAEALAAEISDYAWHRCN